jgi:hypothetical protein
MSTGTITARPAAAATAGELPAIWRGPNQA